MTVLGVDIGNAGAIALIDKSGELVDVVDMPTRPNRASERVPASGELSAKCPSPFRGLAPGTVPQGAERRANGE